jgi:DNA modification methylase
MANLDSIAKAEKELTAIWQNKLQVNRDLSRTLVSFQANKKQTGYRWFKYKEGFSASLVHYILERLGVESGRLIDPFAGSGAALFVARSVGIDALGIEVLPVGCEIIRARRLCLSDARASIANAIDVWQKQKPWATGKVRADAAFAHLPITNGAFPPQTETALVRYLSACDQWPDSAARSIFRFAAMCILEDISYTRKDGQYLRWDYRSGRKQGAKVFDKGTIHSFSASIVQKLKQIRDDIHGDNQNLFAQSTSPPGEVNILCGSCLDQLSAIEPASFDCLITSPPYCNRYDYTRTYALELAFLGVSEDRLKGLRQSMVSCTVENRVKTGLGAKFKRPLLERARQAFASQKLLHEVLEYLEAQRAAGLLNNTGIPRMVRNYFWELTLVIAQCARILKPGATFVMVNDNVRYEGAGIPVDLILSEIAGCFGFDVEKIWVLPVGKGNSSQQMGNHGRDELRKCVYLWRAPKGTQRQRSSARRCLRRPEARPGSV